MVGRDSMCRHRRGVSRVGMRVVETLVELRLARKYIIYEAFAVLVFFEGLPRTRIPLPLSDPAWGRGSGRVLLTRTLLFATFGHQADHLGCQKPRNKLKETQKIVQFKPKEHKNRCLQRTCGACIDLATL